MRSILEEIAEELDSATLKFHDFHSFHEGYGVIHEEMAELLDAIRDNDSDQIRAEALQVAAMCVRLVRDCCDSEDPKHGRR